MSNFSRLIVPTLALLVLISLGYFQNCSPVAFEPNPGSTSQSSEGMHNPLEPSNPEPGTPLAPVAPPPTPPADPPSTLPPVCPAGQTYNGQMCVPFAAICKAYEELHGSDIVVPPRGSDGVCFVIKMVDASPTISASNYPEMRYDITARAHDPTTTHPRIMGSKHLASLKVYGEREIILSGSKDGTAKIMVDNFFLVESLFQNADGSIERRLFGQGTADAPRPGLPLLVNHQEVTYIAGRAGGTDIISPVDLKPFIPLNRSVNLRISSLDCGSVGGTSDIYLLFR